MAGRGVRFPPSNVGGVRGSIGGRIDASPSGAERTYRDVYSIMGKPGVAWEDYSRPNYGRDAPKATVPDDVSPIYDFTRTVESVYAGRDVTQVSVGVVHEVFLARCDFLSILFETIITRERNFVVFRHLTNIIPHQYVAHGVPGHTMTLSTEQYKMSKTTQNAALAFDMRVLQDPIFGPEIMNKGIQQISTAAAMAIRLRQMIFLANAGANNGIMHHLASISTGKYLDNDDDLLSFLLRNFAATNKGPEYYLRIFNENLRILDSVNPGADRIAIVPNGFQEALKGDLNPNQAQELLALVKLLGDEAAAGIQIPNTTATASSLGLVAFANISKAWLAIAPDAPMNEHVKWGNVLENLVALTEHYIIDPMRVLRSGPVDPRCNPNAIDVFNVLDNHHVTISIADALSSSGMFNSDGELNHHVDKWVSELRGEPYENTPRHMQDLVTATASLQPYDPVSANGAHLDHGFLFGYWSKAEKKNKVTRIIGQMRHAYLPDSYVALAARQLQETFGAFGQAVGEIIAIVEDIGSRELSPAWIQAVVAANTQRLYRRDGAGFAAHFETCPSDRQQGHAVIPEWPGNFYGGMDLPSAPGADIPRASYFAGYASGPGLRTIAREYSNGNPVYADAAKVVYDAVKKFDATVSAVLKTLGHSHVFNTKNISAWFHTENLLTRVIEVVTSGRATFLKVAQPNSPQGIRGAPANVPEPTVAQLLFPNLASNDIPTFLMIMSGIDNIDPAHTVFLTAVLKHIPAIAHNIVRNNKLADFVKASPDRRARYIIYALAKVDPIPVADDQTPLGLAQVVVAFYNEAGKWQEATASLIAADGFVPTTAQRAIVAAGTATREQIANLKDAYRQLLNAILTSGAVATEELMTSRFTANPNIRYINTGVAPPAPVDIPLNDLVAGGVIAFPTGAPFDAARVVIREKKLAYDAAVAAVPAGNVSLESLQDTGIVYSVQPSISDAANYAWIRSPLVVTSSQVARACYQYNDPACLVGDWKTGYGTPAFNPAAAWSKTDGPRTRVAGDESILLEAFRQSMATRGTPIDRAEVHKAAPQIFGVAGAAPVPAATGNGVAFDNRPAQAFSGQHLVQDLTQRTTFLGINMYDSALFQQADVGEWMDGPMLDRIVALSHSSHGQDKVSAFMVLAYLLVPINQRALVALGRQFFPFKCVLQRINIFNTESTICATAGQATLIGTPSYTAIAIDNLHDTGALTNRIEAGIKTNIFGGALTQPNVVLKNYVFGMNTHFLSAQQIEALGSPEFVYDRQAPCMFALLAPLTASLPNILRMDGLAPNQRFVKTFTSSNNLVTGSRLPTLPFYLHVYPALLRCMNAHGNNFDQLRQLSQQMEVMPSDARLAPLYMDSMVTGVSRYSFSGPYVYTKANGEDTFIDGISPLGEARCQSPGSAAVYTGSRTLFDKAAVLYSKTSYTR